MERNVNETQNLSHEFPNESNVATTRVTGGVHDVFGILPVPQNQSIAEKMREIKLSL